MGMEGAFKEVLLKLVPIRMCINIWSVVFLSQDREISAILWLKKIISRI